MEISNSFSSSASTSLPWDQEMAEAQGAQRDSSISYLP